MSNEEKLVRMLKYVSEHNDFYKKRIKEYGITNPLDITQWPVLTRKELQENRYNMFSDGYKSKYFNQQLHRQSSSGSSGMPVHVYWDYKDWYASNMCLWQKRLEWYGIKPGDRYCIFTLNASDVTPEKGRIYYTINESGNMLLFNVSLIRNAEGYQQIAKKINEFKPDWLYIQPFVLNQLIHAYQSLNLEVSKTIRYIESVGEILTSDLRKRAEEIFHVQVTNMYGSEEMNGIAIENLDGEMQILTDNVFLEVVCENEVLLSGNGEAIITSLNNYAMPLIRYNQGDMLCVRNDNKASIIYGIEGRSLEFISIDDATRVSSVLLSEAMSKIINQFPDTVRYYHYIYNRTNRTLSCLIDLHQEKRCWITSIAKELTFALKQKIKMIEIKIIPVEIDEKNCIDTSKRRVVEIIE